METQVGVVVIILNIVIVIFSVVIHEVAHGYVAYTEGDMTAYNAGRLTLNPIKHLELFGSIILPFFLVLLGLPMLAWAKPVPFDQTNLRNPRWGVIKVALAGVVANIILALFFAVFLQVAFKFELLSAGLLDVFYYIVFINLLLALFNLMPIPPLDGSKVITALLPSGLQSKIYQYENYGFFVLIVFIIYIWPKVYPVLDLIIPKLTTFLL